MSITAATPLRFPSASATTGIPPPPTETTTKPASISARIASSSTIRSGAGDATTRRQPRPASSRTAQPSSSRRRIAVGSSMNEPIGFDGLAKAGSSAATSICVTTETAWRSIAEPVEVVLEVLRERVADRALAVGAADVQRHLVQLGGGELGAAEDEADLRAVAVPDGDVPAVLDHRRDVPAGLAGRDVLVADALVHRVLDQRVAADRDDCAPAAFTAGSRPWSAPSAPCRCASGSPPRPRRRSAGRPSPRR